MNAWGKIIGSLFGLLLAGPVGLLFGVLIGHFFDKSLYRQWQGLFSDRHAQAQQVFFDTVFLVMGHIAKLDGHVSRAEIHIAQQIMHRLGLDATRRREAIQRFNQGKQSSFDLESALRRLAHASHQYRALLQLFIEIQLQTALAKGHLTANKRQALEKICHYLGFSPLNFIFFEHLFSQTYQTSSGQQRQQSRTQPRRREQMDLQAAYAVLEINEQASHTEIKRAYRRLMSQHHPDKLQAKGLPESMIKLATEKTQRIKAAYDLVCTAKGL